MTASANDVANAWQVFARKRRDYSTTHVTFSMNTLLLIPLKKLVTDFLSMHLTGTSTQTPTIRG